MDGTISLRGRVGSDPTSVKTKSGTLTVRFRLAVSQWRRTDAGEFEDLGARWYTVRAWGRLAQFALASLHKGDPVVVLGRPTAHAWANSAGEILSDLAIHAHVIGHDLNYGTTTFFKNGGQAPVLTTDTDAEQGGPAVSVEAHSTPADSEFHTPFAASSDTAPSPSALGAAQDGSESHSLPAGEDAGAFHGVYDTATSHQAASVTQGPPRAPEPATDHDPVTGRDPVTGGESETGDTSAVEDEPLALSA